MLDRIRRLRFVVVGGAIAMTVGRAVDLRWHATHDEFETGADQLEAHWLAWLGALVFLVTATVGVARRLYRSPGFVILFGSACAYAIVAVWHFWLHNQLRDLDLPHVLLALSQLGLYVGTGFIAAGLALPRCREKYLVGRARAQRGRVAPASFGHPAWTEEVEVVRAARNALCRLLLGRDPPGIARSRR